MAIKLEIWGDYACFSRPEMKVERVSYDVITPSAARGIIEAIYWHPGLRYVIDKIRVCSPIRFTNIRRNEVKDVISCRNIKQMMDGGTPSWIATPDSIVQRAAMVLRDVHYVIEAHFEMTDKATLEDNPGKFQDILTRRIEKGQFFHQPCLGVREFPANFKKCQEIPACPEELSGKKDLGWMLYDMDYTNEDSIKPCFFRAELIDGVLDLQTQRNREAVVR